MRRHATVADALTRTGAAAFGRTFAGVLEAPVLVIGRDTWNRLELAALGVTQLRAARIVSAFARDVHARSIRDFYARVAPGDLARHPGVGLHTLYVIWRAFGDRELDAAAWYWRGRAGAIRTFLTVKARESRAAAAERAARRSSSSTRPRKVAA